MKQIIFTSNELDKIKELYSNGLSCLRIGEIFNVSKTPITKILKSEGLIKKSKSNGVKIILSTSQKNKIKKMYCDEFKTV